MKTLAVISRKGGAGKTTVAVNMALSAHFGGRRVLLIDSDPQRSASLCLRSRRSDPIPVVEANSGKLFQAVTAARRDGYDLAVIDTPAHPEADVAQAANLADLCLAVCRPTFLDIASVVHSAEMIRRLGRRGAVAINQAPPPRTAGENGAIRRAADALALVGLPYAGALCARVAFQRSLADGLAAGEGGPTVAGEEVRQLWDAVLLHLDPAGARRPRPGSPALAA
ncbi:MAG: AAA family ATPase [Brevundimonas sp.]|jgi:chromosome partitioning protein